MTTQIKGNDTSTFGGGLDLGSNTITTTGSITGDISVDALSTASGSAPSYSARAWVNFNGTGTVAIRASGNVSSITDNGTGDYTVNFTTAMPDANYNVCLGQVGYWNTNTVTTLLIKAGVNPNHTIPALKTTTQIGVMYADTSGTATYYDCNEVNVSIFR